MEKLVDLFTHHAVLPEFWMWVIFGVAVLVLLLWDLLFFNRKNEVPNFCIRWWFVLFIFWLPVSSAYL